MNAFMIAETSGPVPTFSPSFAHEWVTPALIGLAWQMKSPSPHVPFRMALAQVRAKLVSCTSGNKAGCPTDALVAFTSAMNAASSLTDAAAWAGATAAMISIHTDTSATSRETGR
ncbi:MAG: hypothetical protein ACI81L_001380 [Verrucomicrobiales bacterium]|jgi:hypothetical protein